MQLAPQADTPGLIDKLVIDATSRTRTGGDHSSSQVHDLPETAAWLSRLRELAAHR
jgi:vanillate/4-hydroxybenzoate decarboxylase subunit C